jgi:glycosyltransferase involved in cell wall biosynthesis
MSKTSENTQPKISLCMIVKNEEKSLATCLNSVKDLVEEIVIVDTGSTDNTVKIAESFKAKVEHFQWCDNFAIARNEALQYVQGEWVLVLDGDEVLNPEIIPFIQEEINNPDHLVINLVRQEIGAIQSPYSLVSRLFRRHPEISFSRPYHSMIDDSVAKIVKKQPHWKILSLSSVAIFHYGYQPETIAALDKTTKAKQAMEKFLKQNPQDAYTCSKLGAIYLQEGAIKQGIKLLKQGLNAPNLEIPVKFELCYHLANAYGRSGDDNRAIKYYKKAIEQPFLPQLKLGAYNNLAGIFQRQNNFSKAQNLYEEIIKIAPDFAIGYYNLGMSLKAQGNFVGAIEAYQKAIQLNPNHAESYQNLAIVFLKIGKIPECLAAFETAINKHQSQNNFAEAERIIQGLKELGFIK